MPAEDCTTELLRKVEDEIMQWKSDAVFVCVCVCICVCALERNKGGGGGVGVEV